MPKTKQTKVYDIAVVGGGPSGRIAALSFAKSGFSTVLVASAGSGQDGRTTALWQKSISLLEEIGVWPQIKENAAQLRKMRMIDDTGRLIRAPEVVFDSAELDLEEFGFNILNSNLNAVLEDFCGSAKNLTLVDGTVAKVDFHPESAVLHAAAGETIEARLVVAADGRNSLVREAACIEVRHWSYPQAALVVNLEHGLPHHNISTEFHTPSGPFTLVPLPGRQSSLVCVESVEGATRLMEMKDPLLERELERRAHSILGSFKLASKVQSFPLSGLSATRLIAGRVALIGETAHVFPPIGAQGLNLSLRDIADLDNVLSKAALRQQDIGGHEVLKTYEANRKNDVRSRTQAVDLLNRSLLTGFLPVQLARGAGMYLAGKVGPFRRLLMREGMAPGSGFTLNR
ncbi:UbiH/UbiF family hydroxylase [Roseibium marinum]|uniref:2-octaprenyl-6-methoxyphenol hydroxylase n=1 Tax=Roseibium marinum TaxID=281252 RepID=A0A2S3UQY7_9HYPH|nr:UbiH/UbiF family hydroxylase [Roseibium marinum]POF29983.1 2-octaprenyl-6-methoxyphenol hydroxylase [Roseibium marinum]